MAVVLEDDNNDYYLKNSILYFKEIQSLKNKIKLLEDENIYYRGRVFELSQLCLRIHNLESTNNRLMEDSLMKSNIIDKLHQENLKLTKDNKKEELNLTKKFDEETSILKGIHETDMMKMDTTNSVMRLNETQHAYIEQLEKIVDDVRKEKINECQRLKLEHDLRFSKLKKQTMDFIKDTQKNMAKNNADNLEINTKMRALYKNQMINELEAQSEQIMELLKINEKLEKKIYEMKHEIEIHESVEKMIKKENNKYLGLIQKAQNVINHLKNENNNENSKDDKDIKVINDILSKFDNNKFIFRSKNKKLKDNILSLNNKKYKNFQEYEKLYKSEFKKTQDLKDKLDSLKSKEENFQKKYQGIIKLYDEALEKLIKDEKIKNQKNIFIKISEINKGNFACFSEQEKYNILVILINHLLPIINIKEKEMELIKKKMDSFVVKMDSTQGTFFTRESSRNHSRYKSFFNCTKKLQTFKSNEKINNFKRTFTKENIDNIEKSNVKFMSIFDNNINNYDNYSNNLTCTESSYDKMFPKISKLSKKSCVKIKCSEKKLINQFNRQYGKSQSYDKKVRSKSLARLNYFESSDFPYQNTLF